MPEHERVSESSSQQSKGKGVAPEHAGQPSTATPKISHARDHDDTRSLASRIADSGASLASSILNARSAGEDLAQYAASSSSKSEQARRHHHSSLSVGESSSASSQRPVLSNRPEGTFRSAHVQEHVDQQEAAFSDFLDNANGLDLGPEPAGSSSVQAGGPFASDERRELKHRPEHEQDDISSWRGPGQAGNDVGQQEAHDGAAVVDLLSRYEEEPPEEDLEPSLSENEIAKLRQALFGNDQGLKSASRNWDHVLNFIPDFVRPDQNEDHTPALNGGKAEQTYVTLGVTHPPEASRIWVEQWEDVLSHYTDEVWGDLLPLVRTAQKELRELEEAAPDPAPGPTNTKALDRLRQILGHVRGNCISS